MCSRFQEASLWSSSVYQYALLTYIGRIYGQRIHMYRIFTQLMKDPDSSQLDELDLLKQIIEKTKQRCGT